MIRVVSVVKDYALGEETFRALHGISFEVLPGMLAAIVGQSGSGKSTLLNILGGLDRPTAGQYWLNGKNVGDFDRDTWAHERNHTLGFVFQSFQLIPTLTAWDNVALPLVYRRVPLKERRERARHALSEVGLGNRLNHKPAQLSGGQQQRVAIARALIGDPRVLLADEPTGNLDTETGVEIMSLLQQLNRAGRTIVIVTHSQDIASQCRQIIHIQDGRIIRDDKVGEAVTP